ncbi:MAG TPA: mechanosensitive ion channel domain-containing protein [Candidatus Acidoferrum sp.]|jgi:small-conductance mechanosensitive channel|nr:mechanosensitive ion channel domain-containing protein [Candidatus Acidoferrum sp.]
MKLRHWITGIVLLLLMALAIAGFLRTREHKQPAESEDVGKTPAKALGARNAPAVQRTRVDQRPLQTARRDGTLAYTQEEKDLARQAEKIADHEVDLAFFDAFRAAQENPQALTPALKQLADSKNRLQQAVQEDQDSVDQLKRRLSSASESQKANLQDQLGVAQSQLELDQDERDDAAEALEQAGGDPQAEVQRQKQQHDDEEAYLSTHASAGPDAVESNYQAHTLLAVFRAWKALREKKAKLEEALQDSVAAQASLSLQRSKLTFETQKDSEGRQSAKQQAKGFAQSSNASNREDSKAAAQTALDSLKHHRLDQKNLTDLGRRLQDEQELGQVYGRWIVLVENRERAALHNLIEILLWILAVLLLVYLAHRLIDQLFGGVHAENKRVETLRSVIKFAAEALGVIVILFIVFGMPSETTTILGLAGAGLTVASKDVIMAFFGWFLLMGRNGIRVGDWVEINGVGGEVVEIGLLKTVLLETGNWTDAGHPTGRRVSFVNSFAIEGHYFNFSTSGQWMWDELQLTVPADQDPYAVIDGLQKLVKNDTEANAKKAEQEWQGTTTRYHVQAFSAEPAINVRPSGSGVEVRVRYITRAYERHETRKRLYEAVVAMLRGKGAEVKQLPDSPAVTLNAGKTQS